MIGALIGWGMPEERVKRYEEGVKNGGILMGVHARDDEDAAHLENRWSQRRSRGLPLVPCTLTPSIGHPPI